MELLVAYADDPAGSRMAGFLSRDMTRDGDVFCGRHYDLVEIPTPAISADWLEEEYDYDGFVFLSKHMAASGVLALTCHSTGNFSDAKLGGRDRQVAIPHPGLQKKYLQTLRDHRSDFAEFDITIEATHHGPTSLTKPSIFIEIGTTERQWTDDGLCHRVAGLVREVMSNDIPKSPVALCFGGTHYSEKFTAQLLDGRYALGTVMPKRDLGFLDDELFSHILERNDVAEYALLDWHGLGPYKQRVLDLLGSTDLEVVRL